MVDRDKQHCANCYFAVARSDTRFLNCHRYPPTRMSQYGTATHPSIEPHHWCGEWKPAIAQRDTPETSRPG